MIEVKETAAERGKRDLWFLANVILGKNYPDLVESVHKPVCDVFVQKNPDVPLKKISRTKNRLILDPRGHFKTSLDIIDCIQWMLAYPDVRILLLSGTERLVKRMNLEIKSIFTQNEDFRAIYPEYCPEEGTSKWYTAYEFTLPNRTRITREPTLSVATVESQKAGSHYDVAKGDDVVNEINSSNPDQCDKIISLWNHVIPLVDPGGYKDLIGTRYSMADLYGEVLDKSTSKTLKYFMRPAWTVDDLGKKTVLFPERFCLDEEDAPEKQNLEQIQRQDPWLFSCQYLNNPLPIESQSFPAELLKTHVIERAAIPSNLKLFVAWDFAFSANKHSDYTVGAVGGYDLAGTLYILDILRGQWTPQQIINMMLYVWRTWPVSRQAFEDIGGSNMILPGLESAQRQAGIPFPVDLIPVSRKKDRTIQMVSALEPLLRQNKLYFSSSIGCLQDVYEEFTKFPQLKHDDIPMACSLLLHYRHHRSEHLAHYAAEIGGVSQHSMFAGLDNNPQWEDGELSGGLVG